MRRRFKLINAVVFLIVLLFVIALAVLVTGRMDRTVEALGTVAPAHRETVRSEVDGIIDSVLVVEDDSVHVGDTLAIIRSGQLMLAAETARKALERAEADLAQLKEEYHNLVSSETFETQSAFASLYQARQQAEIAHKRHLRAQALFEKDLISQEERDESGLQYELAQSYCTALEERADLLRKRLVLQIQKQEEQVELAAIENEYAEADLRKLYVTAPMTGRVLTDKTADLLGRKIVAGQAVLDIGNLSDMDFIAAVSEADIPGVRTGQKARIYIKAFPRHKYKVFHGVVRTVPNAPTVTDRGVFFEVGIKLLDPWIETSPSRMRLSPGLTGETDIVLEENVRLVELLLGSTPN